MSRLLGMELRRLFSRRMVMAAMAGLLVAAALTLVSFFQSSQPMTATERAQAEEAWAVAQADWAEHGDEMIADCLKAQEQESELLGEDVDYGCEAMAPQREWFIAEPPPFEQALPPVLLTTAPMFILLGLVAGATFTGAEASTGSLAMLLTFVPRRMRVFGSKVVAAGVGTLPAATVALGGVLVGTWLIADGFGQTDGMTGKDWSDIVLTQVRVLALVGLAAAAGAVLGLLLRHTAAVLGVLVGWAVAVEGIAGSAFQRSAPWLFSTNVNGFVDGGTQYPLTECTTDARGTTCDSRFVDLAFSHSVVYLLVAMAVLVLVGALVFRRRDV